MDLEKGRPMGRLFCEYGSALFVFTKKIACAILYMWYTADGKFTKAFTTGSAYETF